MSISYTESLNQSLYVILKYNRQQSHTILCIEIIRLAYKQNLVTLVYVQKHYLHNCVIILIFQNIAPVFVISFI